MLATKATMEKFKIPGTLKFFGEPAEKICGSKPVHAAKGYFDSSDAFVVYHPRFTNTVSGDIHFGSYWSVVFTFETISPERWIDKSLLPANTHQHGTARCPGAIDALQPFSTGGVYVNYLGEEADEGAKRIQAAYGIGKHERLVKLKNKYDPGNLFRLNQNIKPA